MVTALEAPDADRWWDAGDADPVWHLLRIVQAGDVMRDRLFSKALWALQESDPSLRGARIGLLVWAAQRRVEGDAPSAVYFHLGALAALRWKAERAEGTER